MAERPRSRNNRRSMKAFNLGVIGRSNSGKSTLIKTLLLTHSKEYDSKLPETDFLEKTDKCTNYAIPHSRLVLWDVPGCGTQDVSLEGYDKKIDMHKYDGFIVCCSGPITEHEWELNNLIARLGRRYIFVRTKIDNALESDRKAHPSSFSEKETLEKIGNDIKEKLSESGVSHFLVSSRDPEKFDFRNLCFMLFGEGMPIVSFMESCYKKS